MLNVNDDYGRPTMNCGLIIQRFSNVVLTTWEKNLIRLYLFMISGLESNVLRSRNLTLCHKNVYPVACITGSESVASWIYSFFQGVRKWMPGPGHIKHV